MQFSFHVWERVYAQVDRVWEAHTRKTCVRHVFYGNYSIQMFHLRNRARTRTVCVCARKTVELYDSVHCVDAEYTLDTPRLLFFFAFYIYVRARMLPERIFIRKFIANKFTLLGFSFIFYLFFRLFLVLWRGKEAQTPTSTQNSHVKAIDWNSKVWITIAEITRCVCVNHFQV